MALFEIVKTTTGATSIKNNLVGEIMHNPVGPWIEANTLYVDQSDLKTKLSLTNKGDLTIFDVGLGAAANALAVLHCAKSVNGRKVNLISFEKDLNLLHFALENAAQFEHFRGFLRRLLENF